MLLETIKIVRGEPQFLTFHNERFNASRQKLFHRLDSLDLAQLIHAPTKTETYQCRIVYSKDIEQIEYRIYSETRTFKCFKIIETTPLIYSFKYVNRGVLNQLFQLRETADDILMVHHGQVMDTSIANLAFFDQKQWVTPTSPLLRGTTRERLLREKKIFEKPIFVDDLKTFSKVALMNALLGFYLIEEVIWI